MSTPVVWIIGYPNAGKTAVAQALVDLVRRDGRPVILLDGDDIRRIFALESTDFDRPGRLRNARRIALLAAAIAGQGVPVVTAANTLFREAQEENRRNLPGYFEVYLKASEALRRARDAGKDLYVRFDRGEVKSVLGLDLPGDEPTAPDLLVDLDTGVSAAEVAERIHRAVFGPPPGRAGEAVPAG